MIDSAFLCHDRYVTVLFNCGLRTVIYESAMPDFAKALGMNVVDTGSMGRWGGLGLCRELTFAATKHESELPMLLLTSNERVCFRAQINGRTLPRCRWDRDLELSVVTADSSRHRQPNYRQDQLTAECNVQSEADAGQLIVNVLESELMLAYKIGTGRNILTAGELTLGPQPSTAATS